MPIATKVGQYDYIVVGAGAGGAPLAARLAIEGKRVLVLEAGADHGTQGPLENANEVTRVPALHGVASEHEDLSWRFFVEHYEPGNLPPGIRDDPKRHVSPQPAETGIFYPRASGVGGCTLHNAMITIAGPDSDWDDLADLVGDPSWRGSRMRPYFQRVENCNYIPRPPREEASMSAALYHYLRVGFLWLFGKTPDRTGGRHGFDGWLSTSVQDLSLGVRDRQLIKMLAAALRQAKAEQLERAWTLVRRFLKGEISSALDPNHRRTQHESPEGVVLVPVAIHGNGKHLYHDPRSPHARLGRRSGPRDWLREAQTLCGDRLTIRTDCLVTKVLLSESAPYRAIGVELLQGQRLYRAHVKPSPESGTKETIHVVEGGEVILCGGTFNTPQLLMLSGIGDPAHLSNPELKIACKVPLTGVGKNLQDRYEVSVVGKMKRNFRIFENANHQLAPFRLPDDPEAPDSFLRQWRCEGTGLYATNGAVLGIFKRSRPDLSQPDLFIFGVPLEFRGYQVGYSQVEHYDRFTWVILKSHTANSDGVVKLASSDPRDRPLINFHSFNSQSRPGDTGRDKDLAALVEGVRFVRGIFQRAGKSLVEEIYPGVAENNPDAISQWIRSEAWGHHACGTCRMGRDDDPNAVLDSRFRVRGVAGLRVVDASIFPKIPGCFIVTNIYMASEKAADVILEEGRDASCCAGPTYPPSLFELESAEITKRRKRVPLYLSPLPDDLISVTDEAAPPEHAGTTPHISPVRKEGTGYCWDGTVTGLALSGGGIRSATFCLGLLQDFARSHWLDRLDFVSTISGGGYIGGALGRFFDRLRHPQPARNVVPIELVREDLTDPQSSFLDWLRKHGNYIAPRAQGDARTNFAVFLRNIVSVHFVVGMIILTMFGFANIIRYGFFDPSVTLAGLAINRADLPVGALIASLLGPFFSPWFILVELVVLFFVLPKIVAYWLASADEHQTFSPIALTLAVLTSAGLLYLGVHRQLGLELTVCGLALLSAIIHVEMAWSAGEKREEAVGTGGVATQRMRTRNFLTYDLGLYLALTGAALLFAFVDTIGHGLQQWKLEGTANYAQTFAGLLAMITAVTPVARLVARNFSAESAGPGSNLARLLKRDMAAGALAVVLLLLPLVLYSFIAHVVFDGGQELKRGIVVTVVALCVSFLLALPLARMFVNRSSLSQTYAARLARAYLGASNPLRHRPEGVDVTEVIPEDDVASIRDYRPHLAGGPFHIIGVTVNQTVDTSSGLRKRDRQGELMAVSCLGVTVGEQAHSKWVGPTLLADEQAPSRLEAVGHVLGDEHPLIDELGRSAASPEMLSLRQWIGISGAAIDPGRGSTTNLGTALLTGLVNLRTGYWWDSSISAYARSGFPKLSFVRRLLYLVPRIFTTQTLILAEWLAVYTGPWLRFWHLSDGGFFECSGGYELVRRRLPRIIMADASADPEYEFDCFADFVRKVRIDFAASVESFTAHEISTHVPPSVQTAVGTWEELQVGLSSEGKAKKHAALFWIKYADCPEHDSVLLYLKASLTGDESIDIQQYATANGDFPHQSTTDQFFDEPQWESYRKLGEHTTVPLTAGGDWFWNIPL